MPESRVPGARAAAQARAHRSWARTPDRAARTASARAKFHERFEKEVDPDLVLPLAERVRRAEHARRAYFLELAARSAKARARRAHRRHEEAELAEELRRAADELDAGGDS